MSGTLRQLATGGVLLGLGVLLLLAGCRPSTSAPQGGGPTSLTATATGVPTGPANPVVIIPHNDLFAPYILVMNAGDHVSWINDDIAPHTIVTTPTSEGGVINPTQFEFLVTPGKEASLTLSTPGLYYYYCGLHAALNRQQRAVAFPSMRPYPLAMDGFLYVRGPGISGATTATVMALPDSTFTPWITIVSTGGSVTWVNQTAQRLTVQGVPGYGLLNPAPIALQLAPGGRQAITFTSAGIYDYYATERAKLDPVWRRPTALPDTAGYPVPMEGIVVVLDA
jgi:plastocyanin